MENEQLIAEIKKLNEKLANINHNSQYMVYNANPFKFMFFNFLAGVSHALGTLFGTIVVTAIIIYFLSRINLMGAINNWLENTMSEIRWEKIIPMPQVNTTNIKQNLNQITK